MKKRFKIYEQDQHDLIRKIRSWDAREYPTVKHVKTHIRYFDRKVDGDRVLNLELKFNNGSISIYCHKFGVGVLTRHDKTKTFKIIKSAALNFLNDNTPKARKEKRKAKKAEKKVDEKMDNNVTRLVELSGETAHRYSLNKEDAFSIACNELNPTKRERLVARELYMNQK